MNRSNPKQHGGSDIGIIQLNRQDPAGPTPVASRKKKLLVASRCWVLQVTVMADAICMLNWHLHVSNTEVSYGFPIQMTNVIWSSGHDEPILPPV